MICRDRDTDTESAGLETRDYVLQNWRADVIALAAADGDLLERVSYDPYGIPFGTHPTDLTRGAVGGVTGYGMPDGTLNNDDYSYFLILYTASNWRADWDRDGDIDAADNTAYTSDKNAASGSWGRGVLSNRENILGYAGYVHEPATGAAGGGHGTMWHVRHRVMHSGLGRWAQRDTERYQYFDGPSLYGYGIHDPLSNLDPSGECCTVCMWIATAVASFGCSAAGGGVCLALGATTGVGGIICAAAVTAVCTAGATFLPSQFCAGIGCCGPPPPPPPPPPAPPVVPGITKPDVIPFLVDPNHPWLTRPHTGREGPCVDRLILTDPPYNPTYPIWDPCGCYAQFDQNQRICNACTLEPGNMHNKEACNAVSLSHFQACVARCGIPGYPTPVPGDPGTGVD